MKTHRWRGNRPPTLLAHVASRTGLATLFAFMGIISALMLGSVVPDIESLDVGPLSFAPESALAQCPTYGVQNVCVPGGDDAFAVQVVSYSPGIFGPQAGGCTGITIPNNQNGTASSTIGPPNEPVDVQTGARAASPASTSLGHGGIVVLRFTTPISGSGDGAADIWVWESGLVAEAYNVEVSPDGATWTFVGSSNRSTLGAQGFDVDGEGFDQTARLFYVRVHDTNPLLEGGGCNVEGFHIAGSDIDAVAGLSNIEPEVTLTKTADPNTGVEPGDEITYTFEVFNSGSDTLNNIAVADQLPGLSAISCPDTSLAPGDRTECTATYTVTQENVDDGSFDNEATAFGIPATVGGLVTDTDDETVGANQFTGVEIVKEANTAGPVSVGDIVTYTFTVTNTGSVTLEDTVVTDPLPGLSNLACGPSNDIPSGEQMICTAQYEVTQADMGVGQVANTATASGNPPDTCTGPNCVPPTATDDENVPTEEPPELTIVKTANTAGPVSLGDEITYTFEVTNTGGIPIQSVTIDDPLPGLTWVVGPVLGDLDPTESAIGTATYVVTQADVDAGAVANTATADGTCGPNCDVPPAEDDEEVPTDQNPAIDVEKSSDPAGPVSLGQDITYSFLVTNTGDVTLTNVTVVDTLPGISGVVCPDSTLSPDESTTCTATYVVTAADVTAGNVHNSATVTGDPPASCVGCTPPTATDEHDVPTQNPALVITKEADTAGPVVEGQTITYTFTAENTGDVTLYNVTIEDALPNLTWVTGPNVGTLDPTESATGTATYVVTAADVAAGSVANTATATGECVEGSGVACITSPPDEEEVPTGESGLEVIKTADTDGPVAVGDTITYTFDVTNTGDVTLYNVTVADALPGLTWQAGPNVGTLDPTESATATATYVVTAADVAAGGVENAATATGECVEGSGVTCTTSPPSEEVVPTGESGLEIAKEAATGGPVTAGQTITYTFTVENTGEVTLYDVTIEDALAGLTWVTGPNVGTLDPDESTTGTATYLVTEADVAAGSVVNSATATGECVEGSGVTCTVSPPDEEEVTTGDADLDITKEADTEGPVGVGDEITYTFSVTNTGDVTLYDVTIEDALPGLVWVIGPNIGTLDPDETETATATYVVTEADVAAGGVTNTATATGECVPNVDVDCTTSPPAEEEVPTADPGLEITKVADTDGPVILGQTITYTFVAANTGNVTLYNVTIEDALPGLTWEIGPNLGTLAPDEGATGTATYVVTADDVAAGSVANTATATGECVEDSGVTCTTSPPADEEVPTGEPDYEVVKVADTAGPVGVGETITYTFTVTNTGDVTLYDVTINDQLAGLTWVTGPNVGTLDPGASATGTATYVVTEADAAAGEVANSAAAIAECAEGSGENCLPDKPPAEIVVPVCDVCPGDEHPDFTITKQADTDGPVGLGETITYTFTVTNTGNVPLADVTIDDQLPGLTWVDGPNVGDLAVGASATATATYVVTEADVAAGNVHNTATATVDPICETDCDDPEVPPADNDVPTCAEGTCPGDESDITIDKSSDADDFVEEGDEITYTFVVTNTGDVTLTEIAVEDTKVGAVSCPSDTLGAGESMTCTATYTVTEDDVAAGSVYNAATVTGTTPGGGTVGDEDDDEVVACNVVDDGTQVLLDRLAAVPIPAYARVNPALLAVIQTDGATPVATDDPAAEPVETAAPVAIEDTVSTQANTPVQGDARANDGDADTALEALTYTLGDPSDDLDGDPATVDADELPQSGTVELQANGVFVYTPNADFAGEDGFVYTVVDPEGNRASSVVRITVTAVDLPPDEPTDEPTEEPAGTPAAEPPDEPVDDPVDEPAATPEADAGAPAATPEADFEAQVGLPTDGCPEPEPDPTPTQPGGGGGGGGNGGGGNGGGGGGGGGGDTPPVTELPNTGQGVRVGATRPAGLLLVLVAATGLIGVAYVTRGWWRRPSA